MRMAPMGHQLLVPTNVSVTFLSQRKDTVIKTTCKREHLIVSLLMVSEGEAIMSGSLVAGHGPTGPVRCQST